MAQIRVEMIIPVQMLSVYSNLLFLNNIPGLSLLKTRKSLAGKGQKGRNGWTAGYIYYDEYIMFYH